MVTIEEINQKVLAYDEKAKTDIISEAYQVSSQAHEGQKRASGEPYMIHPLEVAEILTQLQLDSSSIAAGLLHDTVEDTRVKLSSIRSHFGSEIALLVDGVTKLSKIKFSSTEEKQAENFRKMILAMAKDIRVILIKLADRLNNMRTLQHLSGEKQRKVAQETLDIYAPLANRLGIQWMKIELEDLCLKYLKPDIYRALSKSLETKRKSSQVYVDKVESIVHQKLSEYKIKHQISGRLKHIFSIYRKMEAQNISFEQVHDIIAYRILVNNIRECYEVLGVIHELWKPIPGRFKDYLAMPKVNNYQSLHTTVICLGGERVEFQIRTHEMHEIAESGIAAHWNYKEDGNISLADQSKMQWLRDLIELQKELKDPAEFLDTVKLDLFATDVYVFTPNGKLIELPYGSCPIDFAYAIHTEVGNQCVGAKVEDKIVPLDYQLRSGETVTVLTRANSRPKRDWLTFVKSSRARAKIRQETKREQRGKSIELGKELISKEIEKYGPDAPKYLKPELLKDALQNKFGFNNFDSLYAQIGYGKLTPYNVAQKILPADLLKKNEEKKETPESALSKIIKTAKKLSYSGVAVGGHRDILVSLGKCCNPLPGDPITGFITRGRGVICHRMNCPRVLSNDPERRIDVSWENGDDLYHQVKIKTVTVDRPGILATITKKISSLDVNIASANIRTTNDAKAVNIFTVSVKSRSQLEDLIRVLEGIKGVISVSKLRH